MTALLKNHYGKLLLVALGAALGRPVELYQLGVALLGMFG